MGTFENFNRLQGGRTEVILLHIGSFFTTWTTILVLILVALGGSAAYYFINGPYELGFASAAIQDEERPSATSTIVTNTPRPSITPSQTSSPTATLPPTATPMPSLTPTLPSEVLIEGVKGHRQSLPLSCESRSAVDWAAFFGTSIDEILFFYGIPEHDNPDQGFVGSVYGRWGQIPPDPYGVHAEPVAQRLREFGLNAKAIRNMTWEELQSELAQGRPVILWVVGHIARGTPVPYTDSSGITTTVAKYEHTVIAIGYSENKITVVDGARVFSRHKGEFLKSWAVLENQAIIWLD